ncbi:unnamed protein product [Musa acuminata var. zebrina]
MIITVLEPRNPDELSTVRNDIARIAMGSRLALGGGEVPWSVSTLRLQLSTSSTTLHDSAAVAAEAAGTPPPLSNPLLLFLS